VAIPVHASHVPERLALFTIIVLGETIVVAALGTSDPEWALSAVVAVLGFLVASAVWWIYFGSGSEVALRPSPTSIVVFVYAHIPLLLALTAVSAGISLAIEQSSAAGLGAGVRRALAGGAAVYLAFVTAAQAARAQGVSAGVLRSRIGAAMALVVLALVGGCWTRSCSWPQRRAFSSALSSSSFGRQNANSRRAWSELDAVPGSSVGVLTGMRALDDHVDEQAKRAPDVELSFVSEEGAGIRVRRRLTADAAEPSMSLKTA
jgi:Bacterial low temperature requirement A protein (LtrA)